MVSPNTVHGVPEYADHGVPEYSLVSQDTVHGVPEYISASQNTVKCPRLQFIVSQKP